MTQTESPTIQPLLTLRELRQLVPLSQSQIYRMVKAGTFPPQVRLGPNRVAWRQGDVADWVSSRPAATTS